MCIYTYHTWGQVLLSTSTSRFCQTEVQSQDGTTIHCILTIATQIVNKYKHLHINTNYLKALSKVNCLTDTGRK